MRAYAISVIFIAAWHIYMSLEGGESPLTVTLLVLIISPFIPYVWEQVQNVKFGKDGFSIERLKSKADETINRAAHGKTVKPTDIDDLYRTVENSEWMTLVLARMLMRKALVSLVPSHNLGPSPSMEKLIELCKAANLLSSSEIKDIERLREITFYAEWWDGRIPTYDSWDWAIENCQEITKSLFSKQSIA